MLIGEERLSLALRTKVNVDHAGPSQLSLLLKDIQLFSEVDLKPFLNNKLLIVLETLTVQDVVADGLGLLSHGYLKTELFLQVNTHIVESKELVKNPLDHTELRAFQKSPVVLGKYSLYNFSALQSAVSR